MSEKMKMKGEGGDPTLPYGRPKQLAVGELMEFPGKKGMYPDKKAAESLDVECNQNTANEGAGILR